MKDLLESQNKKNGKPKRGFYPGLCKAGTSLNQGNWSRSIGVARSEADTDHLENQKRGMRNTKWKPKVGSDWDQEGPGIHFNIVSYTGFHQSSGSGFHSEAESVKNLPSSFGKTYLLWVNLRLHFLIFHCNAALNWLI